ncbi:MAG: hypothetical protein ACR2K3_02790 [Nocardioides sp.]
MTTGLGAGLLAATLFGLGAVIQAHAVRRHGGAEHDLLSFVRRSLRDPRMWFVGVLYLVGFSMHVVAIRLLPLYLAQAAVAVSLVVTVAAATVLGERLGAAAWLAIGVVATGLVLLALGAGDAGPSITSARFVVILWAGVLALLLLGGLLRHGSAAVLGALAGLGYAGIAISVRSVEGSAPLPAVAGALALCCFGVVSFWLYSTALSRATVSSVTAPLIVGQTCTPAVVGLLALGDHVRSGWWPGIVIGLVLATAGAVALGRDEHAPIEPAETVEPPVQAS